MSNLSGKFTSFEDQLATYHSELMTALGMITTGLVPDPSAAFATLIEAIGTTNTLLAAMHDDQTTQLQAIADTLDLINSNASLNAQRLLALMLQTACPCDPAIPMLEPPLLTTPTELEADARCQRIQYFVDLWCSWVAQTAVYYHQHGTISSFQISNLLALTLLDVDLESNALGDMSTSSRDSIVSAINSYGTGGSVLGAMFDAVADSALQNDLRDALFSADNPAAAHSAAITALSAYEPAPDGLLTQMFFSNWANVMFSATPEVDASAYDPNACAGNEGDSWPLTAGCITFDSVLTTFTNGTVIHCIEWPDGTNVSPAYLSGAGADLVADHNVFGHAELINKWCSSTPTCHVYYNANGHPDFDLTPTFAEFTTNGDYYTFLRAAGAFSLTICMSPPE